jgi:hypothetical protein
MCVDNNNIMSVANTNATKRHVNQDNNNNDEKNKKQRTSSITAPPLVATATSTVTATTTTTTTNTIAQQVEAQQQAQVQVQQQVAATPGAPSDTHVVVGVTNRGYHCKICQKKGGYEQCHHKHKGHDLVDANTGTTVSMTELYDEITRLEQEISTMGEQQQQQQQQQQGLTTTATTSSDENRNNPFASTNSTMMHIRVESHGIARGYVAIDNFSNTAASSIRSSSSSVDGRTSVEDPDDSLLCNLMEKCGLERINNDDQIK